MLEMGHKISMSNPRHNIKNTGLGSPHIQASVLFA